MSGDITVERQCLCRKEVAVDGWLVNKTSDFDTGGNCSFSVSNHDDKSLLSLTS